MNRVKLGSYAALWLVVAVVNLVFVSRWLAQRAVAQVDHELAAAAAQVDVRSQLLAAEAVQLAEAVARAPAVVQALVEDGEGAATDAARVAGETAARVAGDPGRPLLVATSGSAGRTVQVHGAGVQLDPQSEAVLWGAAGDGVRRDGYVLAGGAPYYAVAVPAGRGAGVAVGVPITVAALAAVRAATGAEVTLLVEGQAAISTLSPAEAAPVAAAVRSAAAAPGRVVGVGRLGAQPPAFALPLPMRTLSPLFVDAPATRVRTVGLKGLPRGSYALSQGTAALLAPVISYQWLVLLALVVLALVGVVVAWLTTEEQRTVVPRALVDAADRIGRGEFSARAPAMAGSLGTIASALNHAAEAAQGRGAAPGAPLQGAGAPDLAVAPSPSVNTEATQVLGDAEPLPVEASTAGAAAAVEGGWHPTPPGEETPAPGPSAPLLADVAPRDLTTPEPAQVGLGATPASEAAGVTMALDLPGHTVALAQPGPPEPAAASDAAAPTAAPVGADGDREAGEGREPGEGGAGGAPGDGPDRREGGENAAEGEPHAASPANEVTAPVPPPPDEDQDEEHWRAVYDDFLDVRERCGESREAVPYARFRLKLQANRDQLVARHKCRTVRFQAYAKDGRAALRATPVR